MGNKIKIISIYPKSFRANVYTIDPFRMIGLIDVNIQYSYGVEKVTLAYFRSSGTNSGKVKGVWYPIVGIKMRTGSFTEFTEYINFVLNNCTRKGRASRGWLAKSLFFTKKSNDNFKMRGFSNGVHHDNLLKIGELLRELYEQGDFNEVYDLNPKMLNEILTSNKIYYGNKHSQRENFEEFIRDIFNDSKKGN